MQSFDHLVVISIKRYKKTFLFSVDQKFYRPNDSWWRGKDEDALFKKIFIDSLCVYTFHSWLAFFIFSKVLNVESSGRDSERIQECSNPGNGRTPGATKPGSSRTPGMTEPGNSRTQEHRIPGSSGSVHTCSEYIRWF